MPGTQGASIAKSTATQVADTISVDDYYTRAGQSDQNADCEVVGNSHCIAPIREPRRSSPSGLIVASTSGLSDRGVGGWGCRPAWSFVVNSAQSKFKAPTRAQFSADMQSFVTGVDVNQC